VNNIDIPLFPLPTVLFPGVITERQVLLQITDPQERLQVLVEVLPRFQEPGES